MTFYPFCDTLVHMEIKELNEPLQKALQNMHIESLSEVQQCIPDILEGKDITVQAPTGSGKTLAYLLPVLQQLEPQGKGKHFPKALILVPTRELALQTADTARALLSTQEGIRTAVLTGGVDIQVQIRSFSKGTDIVIATPARLLDHLRRHTFKPKLCTTLVLDEADVMLSMGFKEDVLRVCEALPEHQTLLFSATYPQEIETLLAELNLTNAERFIIKQSKMLEQKTDFRFYDVKKEGKKKLLLSLLRKRRKKTLIFVNTRNDVNALTAFLQKSHYQVEGLHSEVDQKNRKMIMHNFRNGQLPLLVATDIASRGIDIKDIDIILYDLPQTDEDLIHRTGRTSRANTQGTCILFITKEDAKRKDHIQQLLEKKE